MANDILLEHNGILRVRYSGQVDIAERRAVVERVFGTPSYARVDRFLLDYRLAMHLPGDPAAARDTARLLAEHAHDRNARIAWLVTYDHQLASDVEQMAGELGVANRRFRDYDEAIAWLEGVEGAEAARAGAGPEILGFPSGIASPPRRAIVLATDASAPFPQLAPLQFAALARIVQELLDEGLDEAKVQALAGRMMEMVHGAPAPAPTPVPFSTRRG